MANVCAEMVMKLIPNGITVSEQFALRHHIDTAFNNWYNQQAPESDVWVDWTPEILAHLEEDSGVRCQAYKQTQLTNYLVVDEKKYLWFVLKWA